MMYKLIFNTKPVKFLLAYSTRKFLTALPPDLKNVIGLLLLKQEVKMLATVLVNLSHYNNIPWFEFFEQ